MRPARPTPASFGLRRGARRPLLCGFLGVAAALTAGGCGGGPPDAAPTTSAPSSAVTSPATPAPSSTTSSAAPATASPASPSAGSTATARSCRTADLRGSLRAEGGAAGTVYYRLRLTNTGEAPCALGGYSGVSFVDAAGHQLGAPARRDASQGPPRLLVVAPGASVVARLGVAEAGNYDAARCRPATARGLRVYPPNQTASLVVPHRFQACASPDVHLLTIQPYRSAG